MGTGVRCIRNRSLSGWGIPVGCERHKWVNFAEKINWMYCRKDWRGLSRNEVPGAVGAVAGIEHERVIMSWRRKKGKRGARLRDGML